MSGRGKSGKVEPRRVSDVLDVSATSDINHRILNPSPLDTIIGHIMQDAKGRRGDQKKNYRRGGVEYHRRLY